MKAHKYWSLGAFATMIGTFYTGYKNMKTALKYFAGSSLLCMIMAIYSCLLYTSQHSYLLPYNPRGHYKIH